MRALVAVVQHERWLECLDAAYAAPDGNTGVRNYHAARFIAVSQRGASSLYDVEPDGSFHTTIVDGDMEVMVQRHGGLNISSAKGLHDAEEAAGKKVDRLGNDLANGGEYNRRHHAVLRKGRKMVAAVAVGQVILGDKEKPELTASLNEGCAVDLAELEGDDATGGDVLYEFKVPSPLTKKLPTGMGGKKGQGQPAAVGHLYAFGNTEERYRLKILGCRRRGRPSDGPLVHATGRGYVAATRGDYHDALFAKKTRVVPMIVESFGGITPHAIAQISVLARRAKSSAQRDRTQYGRSRTSPRSFFVHHVQMIGLAASMFDAKALRLKITGRKQVLIGQTAGAAP